MINGIGPMQQVRDNLAFTAFYNDVTISENFPADPQSNVYQKIDIINKGALVFASNKNIGCFYDF